MLQDINHTKIYCFVNFMELGAHLFVNISLNLSVVRNYKVKNFNALMKFCLMNKYYFLIA